MSIFDNDFQEAGADAAELFKSSASVVAAPEGSALISINGNIVTAQKVAVERQPDKILATLSILAKMAGDNYYYYWKTKNRDGTQGEVFGPTIKLANDVVREYGNCVTGVDIRETPTHYIFAARVTDLQSGSSMTRLFQQRKDQNTGMKDKDRAADIIFQIGQSKAIRNTVANFLATYVDYALEEAQKSRIALYDADLVGSRKKAQEAIQNRGIDLVAVEKAVGHVIAEWTARDLARISGSLQAIKDGMVTVEDVFPSGEMPKAPGSTTAAPAPPPKTTTAPPPPEQKAEEPKKQAPAPSAPAKKTKAPAKPAAKPKAKVKPSQDAVAAKTEKAPAPTTQEPLVDDSELDEKSLTTYRELNGEIDALLEKFAADKNGDNAVDGLVALSKDPRRNLLAPDHKKKIKDRIAEELEKLM